MTKEKYNTGCKYFDEWFSLCDDPSYPVSLEIKLLNKLIQKKIEVQGIWVDMEKVEGILNLIERFRPYKLTPVQKFLHCIPYTYDADGKPTWDELLLLCGRGFGKNSFASDYIFGATSNRNGIQNYNVDIVATSEGQAKTSFMDVYDTIGNNRVLQGAYRRTKTEIEFLKTNSVIKYHTSNAKTKDGLRPGCIIFDEIHAYENYENIKVFTSALGKVPHPLTMYLTTEGNVRGKVLDEFKTEALEILKTQNIETKMFPFMAKIDELEEWSDEKAWIKANPMLPYLPTLKQQYKSDYQKSLKRASMKLEFILKRLNYVIADSTMAVADWEDIVKTKQEFDFSSLDGSVCVGGIDYASVRDFIGVGLLFRKDNKYIFKHHTFIVEESIRLTDYNLDIERAKFEGLVTIIPGKTMQQDIIADWFIKQVEEHGYKINVIAADSYRKALLDKVFEAKGLPLTEVRSGPISHGKIAPIIEKLFTDHNIIFGDDMMMRWYTNNVKVETDLKGNKTYKKIEPIKRKTDGFMAFIHAMLISLDAKKGLNSTKKANFNFDLSTYSY